MTAAIEVARRDWEEGYRRFVGETQDARRADALYRQLDEVTAELRRRLGGRFTLAELETAYRTSETWAWIAISEHAPSRGWERDLTAVTDAAFHLYSRVAVDFVP
jgi:hypothetical protein